MTLDDSELFDLILGELALTRVEFETAERARFELSPRSWMNERLAKLGYVPAAAINRLIKGEAA